MQPKVGFIGIGIMGQAMAKNILKSGYDLMVYNRTPDKATVLKEAGAQVAQTPKEVADWAEVIIVMVTGPVAIEALFAGPDGILAGDVSGKTLINTSTISSTYCKDLNERLKTHSITFIDAPVSGSRLPAEAGTLIILAGGPERRIAELEPLFLTMGKKVVYCGEVGQGTNMKLMVNLLLGIVMGGLCEVINFGEQCGLAFEAMMEVLTAGTINCPMISVKREMLQTDSFAPQFPLKHMTKDLRFALETADKYGAAIPVGHTIFQLFRKAMGQNLGDLDFAAVKIVLKTLSDQKK